MGLAVSCALALGVVSSAARAETKAADTGSLIEQRVTVNADALVAHAKYHHLALPVNQPVTLGADVLITHAKYHHFALPIIRRVTLDADTLFDFDKALLHASGNAALDDFLAKLKGIEPEVIMAVGHTDRFGSKDYNQHLSEQRVAAVQAYLLSKGIGANRMHTEGKGETQPLTLAGECDGAKSAEVIACLQFDRRVEIEVVGTRSAR